MTDAYDASNRAHVREATKSAKLADDQRRDVVRGIMSVVGGRWWTYDLLQRCHCYTSSFTGDALTSAFAEGERNIGLQLLADIMAICPDDFTLMMQEANDRHNADAARRRNADKNDGADDGTIDGQVLSDD